MLNLTKTIERGTYRFIGQRVSGLSVSDVPIGAINIKAIVHHTGGTPYRIGRINPTNAFVLGHPPLRLLYVRPAYSGYRNAAKKVFSNTPWAVDFDHALGRKMAQQLGFNYVLLIRIPPGTNRAHGRFERAAQHVGLHLHKLCFADPRIFDKWLGRPPGHWRDPEGVQPYRLDNKALLGLTLKQAGQWGFAMGVEDNPAPIGVLTPLY